MFFYRTQPKSALDCIVTAMHTCVQKEALDRRLSLRQPSDSAAAASSAAASNKSHGRKIAPTLVQLETGASSFSTFPSQAFAPAQSQLLAEASARDLCKSNEKLGGPCYCNVQAQVLLRYDA